MRYVFILGVIGVCWLRLVIFNSRSVEFGAQDFITPLGLDCDHSLVEIDDSGPKLCKLVCSARTCGEVYPASPLSADERPRKACVKEFGIANMYSHHGEGLQET